MDRESEREGLMLYSNSRDFKKVEEGKLLINDEMCGKLMGDDDGPTSFWISNINWVE